MVLVGISHIVVTSSQHVIAKTLSSNLVSTSPKRAIAKSLSKTQVYQERYGNKLFTAVPRRANESLDIDESMPYYPGNNSKYNQRWIEGKLLDYQASTGAERLHRYLDTDSQDYFGSPVYIQDMRALYGDVDTAAKIDNLKTWVVANRALNYLSDVVVRQNDDKSKLTRDEGSFGAVDSKDVFDDMASMSRSKALEILKIPYIESLSEERVDAWLHDNVNDPLSAEQEKALSLLKTSLRLNKYYEERVVKPESRVQKQRYDDKVAENIDKAKEIERLRAKNEELQYQHKVRQEQERALNKQKLTKLEDDHDKHTTQNVRVANNRGWVKGAVVGTGVTNYVMDKYYYKPLQNDQQRVYDEKLETNMREHSYQLSQQKRRLQNEHQADINRRMGRDSNFAKLIDGR